MLGHFVGYWDRNELKRTQVGSTWWTSLRFVATSIDDEVAYWHRSGIASYETDWQNYKSIGLVKTYAIQNVFGLAYPLTTKYANGSFQMGSQTSRRAYWGFASDLWAVVTPHADAFDSKPLGSVDLKYVPRPPSLVRFHQQASYLVLKDMAESPACSGTTFSSPLRRIMSRGLKHGEENWWQTSTSEATFSVQTVVTLANWKIRCCSSLGMQVDATLSLLNTSSPRPPKHYLPRLPPVSCMVTSLGRTIWPRAVPWRGPWTETRVSFYQSAIQLMVINSNIVAAVAHVLPLAQQAQADMLAMNVEIAQWAAPLLSPPHALKWTMLPREVAPFQGDVGSLLTTYHNYILAAEVPLNVPYYMRCACIYITGVVAAVATLVFSYTLMNCFHVERWNLFELNRITGVLWVGRAHLFLRSMTDITLLSTGSLELVVVRGANHLVLTNSDTASATRIVTTLLTAGEVSWLVYVLHDLFMVVTKQYTTYYAPKCSLLVWFISALLSFLQPVTYSVVPRERGRLAARVHVRHYCDW
ncbi:Aste57867_3951 [Aphanomyces stellatus]|uniref:Aste57867_3951 protein n=1 Tax=Aphanomyces stellatus TaxID=120398 RepID=A0A485KEJ6_9STRA|nr:hypothetical protein As57867_003940 [Aphanomyces stellatus]VFT81088.1 Aste57867_3951 [Aphanomyces stellatus]